jgi:general secretion pathway protein D
MDMTKKYFWMLLLACATAGLAGCPHGSAEYNEGKKAEAVDDYDTALIHYNRALADDPLNTEYKIKATRLRYESAQHHVEAGQKLRDKGDLQMALAEFQKAQMIDPASPIAQQETQATMDAIASKATSQAAPATAPAGPNAAAGDGSAPMAGPPELKPISRAPISLKMTNDAKVVFDTIAKLAGVTVIFDPDFTSRRVAIELNNVTLQQALDVVALEAKAFWKPATSNIIFVAPDQAQKRRDYEEEVVKTFYLKNTILPQDITEIVNGLRQLLDLRRVTQVNAQNAIVIRDTPDKIMLAQKIVDDIDKPKSEVIVQFAVLQARRDRMRDLGISPGTTASLAFAPRAGIATPSSGSSSGSSGSGSTATSIPLNELKRLSSADYSITLPGATATALLTDSQTRIIDDPQIRIVDGQEAKLKIGDRVPIATGSFQAGVGVGSTGTAGGIVNPLVNTQFQYLDVGVNVDITPRIHPDSEVSMKLTIEVSSVTGTQNIGGISQPVISQRTIQHDVRLQDGEVNILGGLIERTNTKSSSGWPGFAQTPVLKYFTADNKNENEEQEVLIVVIPHIIRLPGITAANLQALASGTDTNPGVRLESEVLSPAVPTAGQITQAPQDAAVPAPAPAPSTPSAAPQGGTQLRFEPAAATIKAGETTTLGIAVQDVQDLFTVPLLLQFDPKVVSIDDVRQGGFLSGGTQPIAIVQRVDKERGQAIISATRMPNTPGISGSGTLFGVVVRGVAPGSSAISIVQINARDSQQRPIQMVTGEARVQVQP